MIEVRRLIGTTFLVHLPESVGDELFWSVAEDVIAFVLEDGLQPATLPNGSDDVPF